MKNIVIEKMTVYIASNKKYDNLTEIIDTITDLGRSSGDFTVIDQKELDIYYDTTCWGCMSTMVGDITTNDEGYELFVGYCPECEPEE